MSYANPDSEEAAIEKPTIALFAELGWRKQQTTRAMVFTTIKDVLDELPKTYTKELYEQKCDVVYQHFYEAYFGRGQSVYGAN